MPRLPKRSKNADCGLTTETYGATASTAPSANRSSPATSSPSPHWREQRAVGVDAGAERAALAQRGVHPLPKWNVHSASSRTKNGHSFSCQLGRPAGTAAVGSCSSAVPTWTARARRPGTRAPHRRPRLPPQPTICASGSSAWTSATHRSASGPMAGPLSPPGRPSGQRGRQRVADHHGVRARVERRCGRSRPPARRRSGSWPARPCRAAGRACTAATTLAAWNGSRTSKT